MNGSIKNSVTILALLSSAGCMASLPPAPVRAPTEVAAGFGRTWDAVIDVFASSNMPIATMDRSSGFIATGPLRVGTADADRWAVCANALGMPVPAEAATFNVVVREDGDGSTVRVTTSFGHGAGACVTRGVYETNLESKVKEQAEGESGVSTDGAEPSGPGAGVGIEAGSRVIAGPDGADMRSAPDHTSELVGRLEPGQAMEVRTLINGLWAGVSRAGNSRTLGMVHVSQLRLVEK